jgi:hypothetical protein
LTAPVGRGRAADARDAPTLATTRHSPPATLLSAVRSRVVVHPMGTALEPAPVVVVEVVAPLEAAHVRARALATTPVEIGHADLRAVHVHLLSVVVIRRSRQLERQLVAQVRHVAHVRPVEGDLVHLTRVGTRRTPTRERQAPQASIIAH